MGICGIPTCEQVQVPIPLIPPGPSLKMEKPVRTLNNGIDEKVSPKRAPSFRKVNTIT